MVTSRLAAAELALGITAGPAEAQPIELEFGPVEVGKVSTIRWISVSYDCYYTA
jgi:hypothetical protein